MLREEIECGNTGVGEDRLMEKTRNFEAENSALRTLLTRWRNLACLLPSTSDIHRLIDETDALTPTGQGERGLAESKKAITVRITREPEPSTVWYYGLVGETFQVYEWGKDWVLAEDLDGGPESPWRHIAKMDAEVLPPQPTKSQARRLAIQTGEGLAKMECKHSFIHFPEDPEGVLQCRFCHEVAPETMEGSNA